MTNLRHYCETMDDTLGEVLFYTNYTSSFSETAICYQILSKWVRTSTIDLL